jgi:hypothetical protein
MPSFILAVLMADIPVLRESSRTGHPEALRGTKSQPDTPTARDETWHRHSQANSRTQQAMAYYYQ